MIEEIIEAWRIHNRINFYLLRAIERDVFLKDDIASEGRNVGQQFAHMHNMRLMWLNKTAPKLMDKVSKIHSEQLLTRSILELNLITSGLAIEGLLKKSFSDHKIKGFQLQPTAFLAYLISQESHHRGQIVMALKQSDRLISKKIGFGLWQWETH